MPRGRADAKSQSAVTVISIITFLWGTRYTPDHVNTLARMVARNYSSPHRFIVVTNIAGAYDDSIETVYDRADFANISSPHGPHAVSCYRRLRLFEADAGDRFGERIVQLDLDTVIVGDMTDLWGRAFAAGLDFVGWRDPLYAKQICGSMFALRAGAHPDVWAGFKRDPGRARALAERAGYRGSDQAWISYCIPDALKWGPLDGAYSYRLDCKAGLPKGARIVFFHGREKPFDPGPQSMEWVRRCYA